MQLISLASFLIHLIGMCLMMAYIALALAGHSEYRPANHWSGFCTVIYKPCLPAQEHEPLLFLGQSYPLLNLQKEALKFSIISLLGFLAWAVVGFFLSL